MAKPGRKAVIDRDDVRRAAATLHELGKPANPYQVQKLLGEGHYQTIQKHLDAMAAEASDEPDTDAKVALTERLAQRLLPLAEALENEAFAAVQQAEKNHRADREAWQAHQTALQQAVAERDATLQAHEATIAELSVAHNTALAEGHTLAEARKASEQALQRAEALLAERAATIDDLQTARDQAHAQAEHLNSHLTQELQARDQRYDEAVQTLQSQLARARETVALRDDTLRQNARELGSLQQALTQAQAAVTDHEQVAETHQAALAAAHEQHLQLTAQRATLEHTVADLSAQMAQLEDANARLTTEAQSLVLQRDDATAAYQAFQATARDRQSRIEVLEAVIDTLAPARENP